jgi:hypothetical protein
MQGGRICKKTKERKAGQARNKDTPAPKRRAKGWKRKNGRAKVAPRPDGEGAALVDEYAIARAMREGMPTKRHICDGCGGESKNMALTPHGYLLCPGCRDLFFEEGKGAVVAALAGDKLFGFIGEEEIADFLESRLDRLGEVW